MNDHIHYVSGFFATHEEAQEVRATLIARGLPAGQLQVFASDSPATGAVPQGDSNSVLKDVAQDGAIGTAVGMGLGALAEVALVAANVSLFIASPLLAPLVMLGWGGSVGALVGAAVGATADKKATQPGRQGWLSTLVTDAIGAGQVVLVAQTRTDEERATAQDVIRALAGDFKDVAAA